MSGVGSLIVIARCLLYVFYFFLSLILEKIVLVDYASNLLFLFASLRGKITPAGWLFATYQCNDCPRCFVIAKQKVSKREGGGGGKKGSSHPRGRNGANFIANRTCGSTNLLLLSGRIMQFRGYNVPFMRSGIRLIYLRTTFDFHLSSFRQLYTFRQRERERESK